MSDVAIVVPVVGRPHHAQRFMDSLAASTGPVASWTVYAVCDQGDPAAEAWADRGAVTISARFRHEPGTFAEKVNLAFRATSEEPWLFLVGSDVRFVSGWLGGALARAAVTGAAVVGTNDLGNDRVIRGEHATHMLIRRDYARSQGASWDGPGVVCHEGYSHQYVDNEIVAVARARQLFTVALGAIVEHLHPNYDKAPDDEVYQLGKQHRDEDADLYHARSAAYSEVGA